MGEHSHIPTSRHSPYPLGGDLPEMYKEFFDPFIGLTAVAAVTEKIKVGTSVCLVPEHNTINLAKTMPRPGCEWPLPVRNRCGLERRGDGRSWS
jgi:alkanesulfonate monooxygenase SsuD/methylene tetrahydromethanopterin reductase-like flavin-dependent oxidoreductase (luciferase family)